MKVLLLAMAIALSACGGPPRGGTVVDRIYTPAFSGSGMGTGSCMGTGYDGSIVSGICTGVVYYNESASWSLIIQDAGEVWAVRVSPEQWTDTHVGDAWPPQ